MDILLVNFLIISLWAFQQASTEVIPITAENEKQVLDKYDFVFIDFYADWCRFCTLLKPIIDELSEKVPASLPNANVAIAKVDCVVEEGLAKSYGITKYPTLRLAKFGEVTVDEYRGQRSVDAILEFLKNKSRPHITSYDSLDSIPSLNSERSIIGIFPEIDPNRSIYSNFVKASHFVPDCDFHAFSANVTSDRIYFQKKSKTGVKSDCPPDAMASRQALTEWALASCTPIVRELTFHNAEELTEIGLPLLIVFFHPDDTQTSSRFVEFIERHFSAFPRRFTFIYANGKVFSHPLSHLKKNLEDLPVVCIDSFQHMFLYPHNITEDLISGSKTRVSQYIEDFFSGKLHRQLHGHPEPTSETSTNKSVDTTPPESVFKKLAPSENRYSLPHEEL